jgi:predicted helicase
LIDRGREKVMQYFLKGENLGLCFNRQIEQQRLFSDIFINSELFTLHSLSLKESNNIRLVPDVKPLKIKLSRLHLDLKMSKIRLYSVAKYHYLFDFNKYDIGNKSIAPLYLYPENTTQQLLETSVRTPNLNPGILQQIAEKLGLTFTLEKSGNADNCSFAPIDLLDYIYAVLHSPNYRETYKEFLKIDFPRVPYPDPKSFWKLVKLGGELRQIHLLESPTIKKFITTYPSDGDNAITRKINQNDFELTGNGLGRVWINDQQYFDQAPVIAWEFYIGGYQPAQKWLKDRHGRTLSYEDIQHYQKIIVALVETSRIMQAIDEAWKP